MKMTVSIKNCARCGKNHEDLEFTKFTGRPVIDQHGNEWNWWAFCDNTNDPILLRVETGEQPKIEGEFVYDTAWAWKPDIGYPLP